MKAGVIVAGLAALLAWAGARPARATDWPGPYDIDGGRYYSEEARDYARLGLDAGGYLPPSYAGRAYFPSYPYATYAPNYSYAAETSDYYYGAYAPSQAARDNMARVRLIVPDDAKVWFDGKETKQGGTERRFESPALTPGRAYSYDVKVRWRDRDGKEMTRTRQVDVSANANVTVDFTAPASR
jgi:uncharacterized protein (TIGR03000 family)